MRTCRDRTLCPYCGVGCGLLVGTDRGRGGPGEGRSRASRQLRGRLRQSGAPAARPPRRRRGSSIPTLRTRRGLPLERVPWPLALRAAADGLREIVADHGPDAVAFYGSGQLLTEEYYVATKLAKGFLGTNNFDTNSRLCMASRRRGLRALAGRRRAAGRLRRHRSADCFFLIGTNTADCHPIVFKRIKRRKLAAPDAVSVIVADPRCTETADIADLYLPLRPGSDIALLNAMLTCSAKTAARSGLHCRATRRAGTRAQRSSRASRPSAPPESPASRPRASSRRPRCSSARARAALTLWSMGINQSHVGHGQERRDHQPAPGHRPDRPARARAPSHSPDSPMPWAGARPAGSPICCRAIARSPDPAARAAGRAPLGRAAGADRARARPLSAGDLRGARAGRGPRRLDPLHQSRRLHAGPGPRREGATPGRTGDRAGRLPPDRNHALRRRPPPGRPVARERRGDDQLRALPDLPPQAGGAAGRGAARRSHHHPLRRGVGLEGGFRACRAPPRSSTSSRR